MFIKAEKSEAPESSKGVNHSSLRGRKSSENIVQIEEG